MSARRRAFIADWRQRAQTRQLLDLAYAVLDEYHEQQPLTLRQIFYRLVGAHGYEKTELAYKRLTELLNKARWAGVVEMCAIRDDGFASDQPYFFDSVDHFLDSIISLADLLRLDR